MQPPGIINAVRVPARAAFSSHREMVNALSTLLFNDYNGAAVCGRSGHRLDGIPIGAKSSCRPPDQMARHGRPIQPSTVDRGRTVTVMDTTGSALAPPRPLPRAKTTRPPSPLELRLLVLIRASGFEEPVTEYPFAKHLGRRWRFDFAWPDRWLAVEVDGGAWVPGGGRHTRGAGFAADHDKFNRAALLGWRVLRFTSRHLADGSALAEIAEALRIR